MLIPQKWREMLILMEHFTHLFSVFIYDYVLNEILVTSRTATMETLNTFNYTCKIIC